MNQPLILVLAGPNGAGKSTAASSLLPSGFPFVNADEVAKKLESYPSPAADLEAARLVLGEMDDLAARRESFAVETTLAGRTLAARIAVLRRAGYVFRLAYLWAPNAEFCIARVANRVILGGHDIPAETIRRRFHAGRLNFFRLYRPLADRWTVYDSTEPGAPKIISAGTMERVDQVVDPIGWDRMVEEAGSHD